MFCAKCGKELPNDAKFCGGCGLEIKQAKTGTVDMLGGKNLTQKKAKGLKGKNKKLVVSLSAMVCVLTCIVLWFVFFYHAPIEYEKDEESLDVTIYGPFDEDVITIPMSRLQGKYIDIWLPYNHKLKEGQRICFVDDVEEDEATLESVGFNGNVMEFIEEIDMPEYDVRVYPSHTVSPMKKITARSLYMEGDFPLLQSIKISNLEHEGSFFFEG